MRHILIGGAWPYANSPLHIGHIASLLPGDVLARYFRLNGDRVVYVSGSDCHGTPVTLHARREGRTSREISDEYHLEFEHTFRELGFSYDLYSKTSHPQHIQFVHSFHKKLYETAFIHEGPATSARCPHCEAYLSDRRVKGFCPSCGARTPGDQCPACGVMLEAESLLDPVCSECGTPVELTPTTQLFLRMDELSPRLRAYVDAHPEWRRSVRTLTTRFLDEGLGDRALTRDMDWGISVPRAGFDDKRIFLWAENVLGYLSASQKVCEANYWDFDALWHGEQTRHYYVHGRTNIPYHTLILPGLLMAEGEGWHLPDVHVASEHMTYQGRTISGQGDHPVINANKLLERWPADLIRYYFLSCGVDKKDTDFDESDLVERCNRDLAGVCGNFIQRTLAFVARYLDGEMPFADIDPGLEKRVTQTFESVARKLEAAQTRPALEEVLELARLGNRYYDIREPWKTRLSHPGQCLATLANCLYLCANLCVLLMPFFPQAAQTLAGYLHMEDPAWKPQPLPAGLIGETQPLFPRISR